MKFEYLLFQIIVFLSSILACVFYKKSIWPNLAAAMAAIFIVGGIFVSWDQVVTGGWWKFNDAYTLGIYFGKLPIEEILFFLVTPWSCLCIWENLSTRFKENVDFNIEAGVLLIASTLIFLSASTARWYTLTVFFLAFGLGVHSMFNSHWMRRKAVLYMLVLLVILTLIFNGYLTARPIVLYNRHVLSGIFIGTIPIEDITYGIELISGVIMTYSWFLVR